ncbi:MAG: hypothetical protein J6S60_04835 [Oscillospiraceae bacterium]|nr:hypothetical protein [Oscillospiraceae bacterium]
MKDVYLEVGGRQLPLAFDMAAWAEIEEQIVSPIQGLAEMLQGKTRVRVMCQLARILAEGGRRRYPENEEITEAWIMANARPGKFDLMITACMDAIAAGMESEAKDDEHGEVDVVLRELNKKKEPES